MYTYVPLALSVLIFLGSTAGSPLFASTSAAALPNTALSAAAPRPGIDLSLLPGSIYTDTDADASTPASPLDLELRSAGNSGDGSSYCEQCNTSGQYCPECNGSGGGGGGGVPQQQTWAPQPAAVTVVQTVCDECEQHYTSAYVAPVTYYRTSTYCPPTTTVYWAPATTTYWHASSTYYQPAAVVYTTTAAVAPAAYAGYCSTLYENGPGLPTTRQGSCGTILVVNGADGGVSSVKRKGFVALVAGVGCGLVMMWL